MRPGRFVKELNDLEFENTFNPYSDRCAVHDLDDAPRVRPRMLLSMLEMATEHEIDSLWIGRDLGYRGGRRTGLAFTDDVNIQAHTERWEISMHRSTNRNVTIPARERQTAPVRIFLHLMNTMPHVR